MTVPLVPDRRRHVRVLEFLGQQHDAYSDGVRLVLERRPDDPERVRWARALALLHVNTPTRDLLRPHVVEPAHEVIEHQERAL